MPAFIVNAETNITRLPLPTARPVDFATDIKPILEQNCLRCHGPARPRGGFRLDNYESFLKGGHSGVAVLPGNSSNSLLIQLVARLDPDSVMPPEGEGEPLPMEEVALLRAWVDQGAWWNPEDNTVAKFAIAPAVGFASVDGNEKKFREHTWQRNDWRSGIESFELSQQSSPDTRFVVRGRAMTDDYRTDLLIEKQDFGFGQFGVEQFRKYDSDTGGYFPGFTPPVLSLDRNLHLDGGRFWTDWGLTLPGWPRVVLGYEYQYREGEKATLQWGAVSQGTETRNIFPAYKTIDEKTHILKLDVELERGGWRFEDNFRGEWTRLNTGRENVYSYAPDVPDSLVRDSVREGWKSFQGANTVRVERQFRPWAYASSGYLYSHLSADADFSLDRFNPAGLPVGGPVQNSAWRSQRIVLERESHVGNLNLLLGPWQSATVALGVQGEWTRQNGTMEGTETDFIAPPFNGPPFNIPDQVRVVGGITDMDKAVVDESLLVRYTRLPATTLFAEARMQQEWIGHNENVAGLQTYMRDTDAASDLFDVRAGFDTSPQSWLKFGSHFRWRDRSTTYDGAAYDNGVPPNPLLGYPTFIAARDLTTQEVETRLTLRSRNWGKTTFTHRWLTTDYRTTTKPISIITPGDVAPGGQVLAGDYDAQIFSVNFTLTPWRRLHAFTTVSYQDVRSVALHDYSTAVVPYRGDTWSVLFHGRYILTDKTDVTAGYWFSRSDFQQDNHADGLPLGIKYDLHGLQLGLITRCTKELTTKLQYGFYHFVEPSSGGVNDYTAHAVFVSLHWRFN